MHSYCTYLHKHPTKKKKWGAAEAKQKSDEKINEECKDPRFDHSSGNLEKGKRKKNHRKNPQRKVHM
jgi:hypothetical protein